MTSRPLRSHILGTGHYVPERVLTNADLERLVDTSAQWIIERTGIHERHLAAEGEVTSDMAAAAGKKAIEAAGISPKDIDMIIVATVTPDVPMPATAMFVQQKIGARADCPGFDLSAACTGFVYGLSMADALVRSGSARYVLVIGAELLSRVCDWKDRSTCVLFGDGAGAVVLGASPDEKSGILSTHVFADGSLAPALYIPAGGSRQPASQETVSKAQHYIRMEGRELFKVAIKNFTSCCKVALDANGVTKDEVEWVFAHQANRRIVEGVAVRIGLPMERFFMNIDRYANTSSASIAIAIDEAVRGNMVHKDQLALLCALGGGVTWGSALIRW